MSIGLRVAGSGHRPPKLFKTNYFSDENFNKLVSFIEEYFSISTISSLTMGDHCSLIITGGALGFDQALAQAALNLDIPYAIYIPFEGFDSTWPAKSRNRLKNLMGAASEVKVIHPNNEFLAYQKRNEAMVDDSDMLVCLYDGSKEKSGTANCIRYAAELDNYEIDNLWDNWVRYRDA